ncbi:MAG: Holliday junction DNA helicase RuvA [Oleiphilaceae bacterium]|jgi:Holliday junction DNA helicase RuvA
MDVKNSSDASQQANIPFTTSIHDEAESALISLGYRPQDAAKAIKNAKTDNQSLEELLKAALKSMI